MKAAQVETRAGQLPMLPLRSTSMWSFLRRRSFWLWFSVGGNVVLLASLAGVVFNLISLPPILSDLKGGAILTTPNKDSWQTTVELMATLGNGPKYTTHNPDVRRAFMRNGEIVNLPTPELHERLGTDIVASRFFVVENPRSEAERIVKFLQDRGYQARMVINAERHISHDAMAFVTSTAFPHWSIVLRKMGPDMGEPLEPWDPKLLQE